MEEEKNKAIIDEEEVITDSKSVTDEEKTEKQDETTQNTKKKSKSVDKRKIMIGAIGVAVIVAGIFGIITLNSPERKVNILSETIEASKKVDLNSLVELKDEYKDKYEVKAQKNNDDYTKVGNHEITYIITNKANNKTQELTKTFNVVDTTPPKIQVKRKITSYRDEKFNIKKYVKVTDIVDGNIENKKINVKGKVNTSKEGDYNLTISVTDNAGNKASKKVTVTIVEKQGTVEEIMNYLRGHWGTTSYTGEFPIVDLVFMNINGQPMFDGTDTCSYDFKFTYISSDYKHAKATAYIYNPAGFQGDYSNPRAVNLGADYTLEFNLSDINNGILYITITGDYMNGTGTFKFDEAVTDIYR